MKTITVERALVDPASFRGAVPTLDGLRRLDDDTIVVNAEGKPLVAYLRLFRPGDAELEALRAELLPVKFVTANRTRGLSIRAVSFGYAPRNPLRGDFCKSTILAREHPSLAHRLTALGATLEAKYREVAPDIFAYHAEQAAKVGGDWRLPGAECFTGGTINRDNAIGYHRDRGNFKATFSAMPVIRHHMDGGELVVPELGVYLPVEDGTVTYFDGQDLMHAVTPLRKAARDAHRFSAVFYSLTQLWHCLPPAAEVDRIQARRTDRELRRRQGIVHPLLIAARAAIDRRKAAAASEGTEQ